MEPEVLETYKKAGAIARNVKDWIRPKIKPGMTLLEISEKVDAKIVELGGKPAWPTDVSMNDMAAHYAPFYQDETVLGKDDLVKIDLGVHIDGYLVDTAFTLSMSGDEVHKGLIRAAEEALAKAIPLATPGTKVSEIGKVIEAEITKYGLKSIRNLSGHSIERWKVHAGVGIPNYDSGSSKELEEGMVIAIEPFPSTGDGKVVSGKSCKVFELIKEKPTRQYRDILKYIVSEYKTLPFCERNIIKEFGEQKAKLGLKTLVHWGILSEFTLLPESKKGSLVAQAEHTVIVNKNPIVLT